MMAVEWTLENVTEFLRAGGRVPFDDWLEMDAGTRAVFALAGDAVARHRARLLWDEAAQIEDVEPLDIDAILAAAVAEAAEPATPHPITNEADEVSILPGIGGGA